MSQPNFTPEAISALSNLLDGQGQVSITHDRPPNGPWFIEVTDVWTDMITKMFTHPDPSIAIMKAVEKKAKVLGIDPDEMIDPATDEIEKIDKEEDNNVFLSQ